MHSPNMETLLVREPLNTTPEASADVVLGSEPDVRHPGWDEGTWLFWQRRQSPL